jgi:pyruvate/2-oxoglutarate dehydrogenase complex dihydrolipoamide acyltransferase (E2) component
MTMTEGTILEWVKNVGDEIVAGEVLLMIATDKADLEVDSPWDGVLVEQLAQPGEVIPVLQPIARIRFPKPERTNAEE